MHLLDRQSAPTPQCLGNYQAGVHKWAKLAKTDVDYEEVVDALNAMQAGRCAYCEREIRRGHAHVEHFRQRDRFAQMTFQWDNLFWSCIDEDTCGKHKDKQSAASYQFAQLVKPDIDNGEDYFRFSQGGSIAIIASTPATKQCAETTLRVFNLDDPRGGLRKRRKDIYSQHAKTAETLEELAKVYPLEEVQWFIDQEVSSTRHLAFCTLIKHVLTPTGL